MVSLSGPLGKSLAIAVSSRFVWRAAVGKAAEGFKGPEFIRLHPSNENNLGSVFEKYTVGGHQREHLIPGGLNDDALPRCSAFSHRARLRIGRN